MKNLLKADFIGRGRVDGTNCFPRSLANAMGIDYSEALHKCIRYGYNNGMQFGRINAMCFREKTMEMHTCEWDDGMPFIPEMPSHTFPKMTVSRLVKYMRSKTTGRYIVLTNNHAFAIVNGKVFDDGTTQLNKRVVAIISCEKEESYV